MYRAVISTTNSEIANIHGWLDANTTWSYVGIHEHQRQVNNNLYAICQQLNQDFDRPCTMMIQVSSVTELTLLKLTMPDVIILHNGDLSCR